MEATIKWASNKKLHLEIALIRAIQTLSEVSLDNVIDALENLRGASGIPPVKETNALQRRKGDQRIDSGKDAPNRSTVALPAIEPVKRFRQKILLFKQSRPKAEPIEAGRIGLAADFGSDTQPQAFDCFVARTCDPSLS